MRVTAFEILYATMRYLYEERKTSKGEIGQADFDFEELEIFLADPRFAEKTASVLNYLIAQVLMKMDCKKNEMQEILASIIEEQMYLIETTLHQYPDGPLRRRSYESEKKN